MSFDRTDYERAARELDVATSRVMAMAAVESAGETLWVIDGKLLPPVRFEAHWFGRLTDHRFNESHPDLSSTEWDVGLAATTHAGAWDQLTRARALDRDAADQATSWGAFQVMGFNWKRLGYASVTEFVTSMTSNGDDGQMEAFVKYVEADGVLRDALARGNWDVVEQHYNGGGFHGSYAAKLRAADELYSGEGAPIAPRALRRGDSGEDVASLQHKLGVGADGYFGPLTEGAVKAFQSAHSLAVDGIAGTRTMAAL